MSLSVGGERERNELAANDMERMRKRKDVRGVDRVEILQQMPLLNVPVCSNRHEAFYHSTS